MPFPRACAYAGKRGVVGGIGRATGRREIGDKGSRARRRTRGTYVCTYGVRLSRRCLPCSFLRSSINETRVQSRRMSNKYVSYPRPSFRGTVAPTGRLLTLFTLFLLNSRVTASFLAALLRESSSYHDRCRPASAHFNPFACCSSPCPVLHPFRLQDGLIRNKIIVLFARTCF